MLIAGFCCFGVAVLVSFGEGPWWCRAQQPRQRARSLERLRTCSCCRRCTRSETGTNPAGRKFRWRRNIRDRRTRHVPPIHEANMGRISKSENTPCLRVEPHGERLRQGRQGHHDRGARRRTDLSSNPMLRRVIQNARAVNMPKDKVEAAIRLPAPMRRTTTSRSTKATAARRSRHRRGGHRQPQSNCGERAQYLQQVRRQSRPPVACPSCSSAWACSD